MNNPIPENEARRLSALRDYNTLDAGEDVALDRVTTLATQVFGVPMALVSFMDEGRQWFKSAIGLQARQADRCHVFCSYAITSDQVLVVEDALQDARFADNPPVNGNPGIRFYAGAPLVATDESRLGTLCVIDTRPRRFSDHERDMLARMASIVVDILESKTTARKSEADETKLQTVSESTEQILASISSLLICIDSDNAVTRWNTQAERILGKPAHEALGKCLADCGLSWDWPKVEEGISACSEARSLARVDDIAYIDTDGSERLLGITLRPLGEDLLGDSGILILGADITERRQAESFLIERAVQAALLRDVTLILAYELTLQEILQEIVQAIVRHLGVAFARIWTADESKTSLTLQSSAGQYTRVDGSHRSVQIGENKIGWIAQTCRPYYTNQVVGDSKVSDQDWALREGMKAFAGLPLIVNGRLIGVLAMFSRQNVSQSTFDALVMLSDSIAIGIERKQAQEALLISEETTRMIVDSALDGIVTMDSAGKVIGWNRQAERIFGWREEEACNQTLRDLIIPESLRNAHHAGVQRLLQSGNAQAVNKRREIVGLRKTGEEFPIELAVSALHLNTGTIFSAFIRDITDRKKTEEALRQQAEIIEQVHDSVIQVDLHGVVVYWNKGAQRIYDYTPEEAVGRHVSFLHFEEDKNVFGDSITPAVLSMGQMDQELRTRHKSGRELYVNLSLTLLKDAAGTPYGIVGFSVDITERKRVDEALRRQRELLDLVLSHIPHAVFWKDSNLVYLGCNKNFAADAGFETPEEIIGKTDYDMPWKPEETELYRQCDSETISSGQSQLNIEETLQTADGKSLTLLTSKVPLKNGQDDVFGVLGMYADISQRKQTEEALRGSEERLQLALHAGEMATWSYDLSTSEATVSEGHTHIFGRAGDNPIRTFEQFMECVHFEDRDLILECNERAIETKTGVDYAYRIILPDGSIRWLASKGRIICDADGFPVRLTGALSDITKRKHAEESLAGAIDELEKRNWEVVEARDAALAAAKAKSMFLANMSHEIRTPLNGVLGMAQVLAATNLNADQQSHLRTIKTSAESLLTVINDILDFSKIESGKITFEGIGFSLLDVFEDTAALFSPRAHEKGIEVCCNLNHLGLAACHSANHLEGDPVRLRQVIGNLLSNAIKFTDKGGEIVLGAELKYESSTEARWRILVADTGIGIPADRQNAIFESFTQADGSTTRKFGGTGLGLTICRQLVTLMGGEMGVISEEGKGSAFWIEITLPKQSSLSASAGIATPALAQTVLVVDDNETNLELLSSLLSSWGCSVFMARSGEEALSTVRSNRDSQFDLILMDTDLPGIGGREVAGRLKEISGAASIQTALLCPIGADGVVEAMNEHFADTHLCKPVRQSELRNLLVRHGDDDENVLLFGACEPTFETTEEADEGCNLRVLIADDVDVNSIVASEILKQYGLPAEFIHKAKTGREALEASENGGFDVILMDVQMPDMDGLEATRAIRGREQSLNSPHIPIVGMTAHTRPEDRQACFDAGMDEVVTKPFEREALFALLDRWLKEGRLQATSSNNVASDANTLPKEQLETHPIISLDRLRSVTAGSVVVMRALMEEYARSAPKLVGRIGIAIESFDCMSLEHWAHAFKGSSRTVGAERLGVLCETLEVYAKTECLDDAPGVMELLSSEWDNTKKHIEELLHDEWRLEEYEKAA